MSDVMAMAEQLAALPAHRRHDAALLLIEHASQTALKVLAHMMLSQLADLRIAVTSGSDHAAEMIALLPIDAWEGAAKDYADGLAEEQMVNAVVRLVVLEQVLRIRSGHQAAT